LISCPFFTETRTFNLLKEASETMTGLTTQFAFESLPQKQVTELANDVLAFMNFVSADTKKGTHYQSQSNIEEARTKIYQNVFMKDRALFGCIVCMSGAKNDFAKQNAVKAFLANSWNSTTKSSLPFDREQDFIDLFIKETQVNRVLNMFVELADLRVNNSRTRKAMLSYVLGSRNLPLWSVKYRAKLKRILTHCWNVRYINILYRILRTKSTDVLKKRFSDKEKKFLYQDILRHKNAGLKDIEAIECIAFILGIKGDYKVPLLKAFFDARTDLKAGKSLPMEVLEGIRSSYHKDVSKDEVIKLTARKMTQKQKKNLQKTAAKAGVAVTFNPMAFTMTELFIYAYEMGLSKDVEKAIEVKAEKLANTFPIRYEKIGIIVDASKSMEGSKKQPLKPIATAQAMRDVLIKSASTGTVKIAGGFKNKDGLIIPAHSTSLAKQIIQLLKQDMDAIFIISDGYENSPSGRIDEVVGIARHIGVTTPIYHVNPVVASETATGMRRLSQAIPVLPCANPEGVALSFLKPMLETDPVNGLKTLVNMTLPMIEKNKEVAA